MARKLRVQYPGAIYHVMNRGDHCETVFRDGGDPELFLATLAEACGKTDWQVHSFCLMSNHFHLVVETPRGNLVPARQQPLGCTTGAVTPSASKSPGSGRFGCGQTGCWENGASRWILRPDASSLRLAWKLAAGVRRSKHAQGLPPRGWCLGSEEFRQEAPPTNQRAAQPRLRRARMAGDGLEEGATHPRRGSRAAWVERRRTGAPTQGRRREGQDRQRPAGRDNHDLGLDCPATAHGRCGLRCEPTQKHRPMTMCDYAELTPSLAVERRLRRTRKWRKACGSHPQSLPCGATLGLSCQQGLWPQISGPGWEASGKAVTFSIEFLPRTG